MKHSKVQLAGFASLLTLAACGADMGEGLVTADDTQASELGDSADVAEGDLGEASESLLLTKLASTKVIVGVLVPTQGPDLTLDDKIMHFDAGAQQGLDIHVHNFAEVGTNAAPVAVTVNGFKFSGHVYPYYPATSPAETLAPYMHGYIHVSIPEGTLKLNPCTPYKVQIDVDRTQQYNSGNHPDVFTNDSGYAWTECLTWLTPVKSSIMGTAITTPLANNTLHQAVSSQVSARPDGQLCSSCHYSGSGTNYHPPVARNTSSLNILQDTVVDGFTWAGDSTSWSYKFLNAPYPHTDDLRAAVLRFRQDVERQRRGQMWITMGGVTATFTNVASR